MRGTAYVHPEATLRPGKLDLLAAWLPDQWWFDGDAKDLGIVAEFSFVDPAGEAGFDCLLVRSSDAVYHIPIAWRSKPLDGGTLIGTTEHSDLGTRFAYDAQTDPAYLKELVRVIREEDTDADIVEVGQTAPRSKNIKVFGSGLVAGETTGYPHVVHKLDRAPIKDVVGQLMGQWRHNGAERVDLLAVLH
jgi:hypothetical protein